MAFYLPYLHMLLPSAIRAQRTDATFLRIYLFESMVSKLLYVTNFSKVVFIWTEQHLLCSEKTRTLFFRIFASLATFLRIYLFESMVSKLLYVTNFSKVVFIWTEQHLLCSEKTRTHFFRIFASLKLNETFVWNNP